MKKFMCVLSVALFIFGAILINSGRAQTASFAQPRGIYVLSNIGQGGSNIRNYPFVTGYVLRMGWADIEKSQGVYDFSVIDNTIASLDSFDKKLTLLLGGGASAEPDYIASTPGVTTWTCIDPQTGASTLRAVPWDPYLLHRIQAFTNALGDHLIYNRAVGHSIPLRDHPVLANVNLGIAGLGEIRDNNVKIADMPGYTRNNFINAVKQNLYAAVNQFPNKFVAVGFWKVTDHTKFPALWKDIRTAILNQFNGMKNPKVGFWQENLAASKDPTTGVVTGYPSTNFAAPLYLSKDNTFIMLQALQPWDNPLVNPSKTANTTPADGLEYGYNTYGCTYFELYIKDIDDQQYWPSFQQWHDFLITAP